MPVADSPKKKPRAPRRFPPSLAGHCLRYAVMEVLGFGRLIDPESRQAMQAGTALHKEFQQQLLSAYAMAQVEVALKDDSWGVSGRMDAVIEAPDGPWVVEYKTVSSERFQSIQQDGPLLSHWAQLQLYLAVGRMDRGALVVEERSSGRRLIFHTRPDPEWARWIEERVSQAKAFQSARKLPEREVSAGCLYCDRWQRCFRSEADLREAAMAHPEWEPIPGLPQMSAYQSAEEIVS